MQSTVITVKFKCLQCKDFNYALFKYFKDIFYDMNFA